VLIEKGDGVYQLEKLSKLSGISHGFSSRLLGDLRLVNNDRGEENRWKFASLTGVRIEDLVFARQVHGNRVVRVKSKDRGKVIDGVDGLVTNNLGVGLFLRTADCLPLIFFDFQKRAIGVAHAGWKGTLGKIAENTLKSLKKNFGSKPENIWVGFGPSIGSCCYDVDEERIEKFEKAFGRESGFYRKRVTKYFLDLSFINYKQLLRLGVTPEHFDLSATCTKCNADRFFSLRSDWERFGELKGEMGTVISLTGNK